MPHNITTREKVSLPFDDYTVVARLTDFGGMAYSANHSLFLRDSIKLDQHFVDLEDGSLYVGLPVGLAEDHEVWERSAKMLYTGIARLALDTQPISLAVKTSELRPDRRLSESFPYLPYEISYEINNELQDLAVQPLADNAFYTELEHLTDH